MRRPEATLQIRILDYLTTHGRRELDWFAIPNGELRHPNVALRLKAQGLKPGVADLCILLDHGQTGWLEVKAGSGLSDVQKGFGAKAQRLGHRWACVSTLAHAVEVLDTWGALRPVMPTGMGAPA